MRIFELHRKVWTPRPLNEVFDFFSDARNLEQITPPWLRFEVLDPDRLKMRPGARVDYRLRVRGVPLRWQSEITVWEPPLRFVDEQRRGPYSLWIHEHRFREVEGGTEVVDFVRYAAPGGPWVERFLVRPEVNRIFDYRGERLREIFGGGDPDHPEEPRAGSARS